jgi:D-sedoheptulose 7-phosphate isomerase
MSQNALSRDAATTYSLRSRLLERAATFEKAAASSLPEQIEEVAGAIGDAFERGRKLLAFGNGGSASDAQHLCGELVVRFQMNRRPLPAIALCCDGAVLTACGNDFSYEQIFERQVQALGFPGDVALGISTSGKSPNVIKGLSAARELGLTTVLMTGPRAENASSVSNLQINAPGNNTARIQELHLASYHLICELIENRFFGGQ